MNLVQSKQGLLVSRHCVWGVQARGRPQARQDDPSRPVGRIETHGLARGLQAKLKVLSAVRPIQISAELGYCSIKRTEDLAVIFHVRDVLLDEREGVLEVLQGLFLLAQVPHAIGFVDGLNWIVEVCGHFVKDVLQHADSLDVGEVVEEGEGDHVDVLAPASFGRIVVQPLPRLLDSPCTHQVLGGVKEQGLVLEGGGKPLVAREDGEVRDLDPDEQVRVEHRGSHEAAEYGALPNVLVHLDIDATACDGPSHATARDLHMAPHVAAGEDVVTAVLP